MLRNDNNDIQCVRTICYYKSVLNISMIDFENRFQIVILSVAAITIQEPFFTDLWSILICKNRYYDILKSGLWNTKSTLDSAKRTERTRWAH